MILSRPLTENVRDSLNVAILGSRVAWAIGGLGLILATVGAFGVFAYAVEESCEGQVGETLVNLSAGCAGESHLVARPR